MLILPFILPIHENAPGDIKQGVPIAVKNFDHWRYASGWRFIGIFERAQLRRTFCPVSGIDLVAALIEPLTISARAGRRATICSLRRAGAGGVVGAVIGLGAAAAITKLRWHWSEWVNGYQIQRAVDVIATLTDLPRMDRQLKILTFSCGRAVWWFFNESDDAAGNQRAMNLL